MKPSDRSLDTRPLVLSLLILLVGGSAFAFGSVEPWAEEWLRFGGLLALTVALWSASPREVFGGLAGRLAVPAMVLVGLGLVQILPLPHGVIATVSPRAAAIYDETVPSREAGSLTAWLIELAEREPNVEVEQGGVPAGSEESGGRAAGRSLSVHPYATWRSCLSWVTALMFFFLGAHVARSRVQRYRLFWGLGVWTGLLGLVAVAQSISWNGELLWIRRTVHGRSLGPFVSPTHYAGWVEMGLLATLGLALALLSRPTGRLDLAGIRRALVDRDWTVPRLLVVGGIAALGLSGLLLSGSEGGLVSFAAGLLMLVVGRRAASVAVVLAAAVVVLGFAVSGMDALVPGLGDSAILSVASSESSPSLLLRVDTWARSLHILRDFPVIGTGLGTFAWSYPAYQRAGEWMSMERAHNDYLQLLSETGLLGAVVLAWGLVVFLRRVLRPALEGATARPRWTTIGTAAAVFAMLLHSIVDFNLQIPSNAVLFSVLVGVLVAVVEERGERRSES